MGEYAAAVSARGIRISAVRSSCPPDLLEEPIHDKILDGRSSGPHLEDSHRIVREATEQRCEGAGMVGHRHLMGERAWMVKPRGRLEVDVQEVFELRSLKPAPLDVLPKRQSLHKRAHRRKADNSDSAEDRLFLMGHELVD